MESARSEDPRCAAVLLELQRALLAVVTPELRAVAVGVARRRVTVRFFYDLPAAALDDRLDTDSPRELAEEVESALLASFDEDLVCEVVVEARQAPLELHLGEREQWVFLRRETARPDVRRRSPAGGVSRPFVLAFPRVLVRASDSEAAERAAHRMSKLSGRDLKLEYIGRHAQDASLAELRGAVELSVADFPTAVACALNVLCSLVYRVTDVQVALREGDHSFEAIFAADSRAPTGARLAGLEWLHAQLVWA